MTHALARIALMLGNFIVAVGVLGIAGMLPELAQGFDATIQQVGLLVTFGAVVLCIGAPLMVWATSRWDRRWLLASVAFVFAVGHLASALAPNYAVLLMLRLIMVGFSAMYTPVAASTIALIVPAAQRSSAIVFVFLGFSLAMAAGLPVVTFLTAHFGWQFTFVIVGVASGLGGGLLLVALPRGIRGQPLSLGSWGTLATHATVVLLLLMNMLQVSGQFAIFTYLGPLLVRLTGAGVATIGSFFALYGVTGFVGNVAATRLVTRLDLYRTSVLALGAILLGFVLWSLGAGTVAVMAAGVACWGLGFAAINSMIQARLVAAVPALASAAIALNTSVIYVGQAIGSGLGGILFAYDRPYAIGYTAVAFAAAGLVVLLLMPRTDTA